jgi:hypothetical protein
VTNENITLAALVVAVLSLLVAAFAFNTVRKARAEMVIFRGEANEYDILTAAAAQGERTEDLAVKIQKLAHQVALVQRDSSESLRHLAVVRFNATQDMGGQFSFSAALLDDGANGIVITSIQAHNQGRVYAKSIIEGGSDQKLTPEELQAINAARPEQ